MGSQASREISLTNLRRWIYRLRMESRLLVMDEQERSDQGATC
ncbi:hypothetical protein [Anaeromyxobacter sp. SG66]|nr:hypothetical protein [Anaeromyxobacter sp. SG66]